MKKYLHNSLFVLLAIFFISGQNPAQDSTSGEKFFATELLGANENPPVNSPGNGYGLFILSAGRDSIYFQMLFRDLLCPFTTAYIEAPCDTTFIRIKKITGDVYGDQYGYFIFGLWTKTDSVQPLTEEIVKYLDAGKLYLNITTATYPKGEIKGQITESPDAFNLKFPDPNNITAVNNMQEIPQNYTLAQNYPNPFNPATIIKYSLPVAVHVKLLVYNSLGELVETLVNSNMDAGYHEVNFNASKLSSGMYIYRIEAGKFTSANKMILIR